MWFRDVVNEAEHQGHHTPVVQIHHRYGMTLFIASEVMFFVAWFWAYFDASLYPSAFVGGVWPPKDIEVFNIHRIVETIKTDPSYSSLILGHGRPSRVTIRHGISFFHEIKVFETQCSVL